MRDGVHPGLHNETLSQTEIGRQKESERIWELGKLFFNMSEDHVNITVAQYIGSRDGGVTKPRDPVKPEVPSL